MLSSLYVHFPFCEVKCPYCDFYSIPEKKIGKTDQKKFSTAITTELEWLITTGQVATQDSLETIFFGGGTPSFTDLSTLESFCKTLGREFTFSSSLEWTIEANPSSIQKLLLKEIRAFGVNRVSLGVQSFDDSLLKTLGRAHDKSGANRALEEIFASGFENVSLDLLCGVPGQSLKHLEASLKQALEFPIKHLSCYLLTLNKGHPMAKLLPNEEEQLAHLNFVESFLAEAGFERYELSNFCKKGFSSRHNLIYWEGGSYLGLGPSAHSFNQKERRRWKNFSSLHRYAAALLEGLSCQEQRETLSEQEVEMERWMLQLRLSSGFPQSWLKTEVLKNRAQLLESEGLLERHPENKEQLRLSKRGFCVSDSVIQSLV